MGNILGLYISASIAITSPPHTKVFHQKRPRANITAARRKPTDLNPRLLKGSWDLITGVINKVTIHTITYKPELRYL